MLSDPRSMSRIASGRSSPFRHQHFDTTPNQTPALSLFLPTAPLTVSTHNTISAFSPHHIIFHYQYFLLHDRLIHVASRPATQHARAETTLECERWEFCDGNTTTPVLLNRFQVPPDDPQVAQTIGTGFLAVSDVCCRYY